MLATSTRTLLQGYAPADDAEQTHFHRMLALTERGPFAFDREHFVPGHFTASAFVVSPRSTHLMLILHSKLGLWLQPGGHVETTDPDLPKTAHREVLEETGLAAIDLIQPGPVDLDIHTIPARKETPAHEHFDVRFLFRARTEAFKAQSDALAAKWVPLVDLDGLETDESVMRAVRKIRVLVGT